MDEKSVIHVNLTYLNVSEVVKISSNFVRQEFTCYKYYI
jgi:hypothetical protein